MRLSALARWPRRRKNLLPLRRATRTPRPEVRTRRRAAGRASLFGAAYWYYTVRRSLGVALMRAGRLDDAEAQFQRTLKHAPANGWSRDGLAELYKARGNADQAQKMENELAKTWIGDRQQLQLSRR